MCVCVCVYACYGYICVCACAVTMKFRTTRKSHTHTCGDVESVSSGESALILGESGDGGTSGGTSSHS